MDEDHLALIFFFCESVYFPTHPKPYNKPDCGKQKL